MTKIIKKIENKVGIAGLLDRIVNSLSNKEKQEAFSESLKKNIEGIRERIDCHFKPFDEEKNYYETLRFKIFLKYNGSEIDLADGGFVNWTQQMLSNRKQRLLISGAGLEIIYKIKAGMI